MTRRTQRGGSWWHDKVSSRTLPSFQSRVVPASRFTMAVRLPVSLLNSVLLPTLGHPTSATVNGLRGTASEPRRAFRARDTGDWEKDRTDTCDCSVAAAVRANTHAGARHMRRSRGRAAARRAGDAMLVTVRCRSCARMEASGGGAQPKKERLSKNQKKKLKKKEKKQQGAEPEAASATPATSAQAGDQVRGGRCGDARDASCGCVALRCLRHSYLCAAQSKPLWAPV